MIVLVQERHNEITSGRPPDHRLDGCYDVPLPSDHLLPQIMMLVVLREPLAGPDQAHYCPRQRVLYVDSRVTRDVGQQIIEESIYRLIGMPELAPHTETMHPTGQHAARVVVHRGGRCRTSI